MSTENGTNDITLAGTGEAGNTFESKGKGKAPAAESEDHPMGEAEDDDDDEDEDEDEVSRTPRTLHASQNALRLAFANHAHLQEPVAGMLIASPLSNARSEPRVMLASLSLSAQLTYRKS